MSTKDLMQTTLAAHIAYQIKNWTFYTTETVNKDAVPLNSTEIPLDVISVARRWVSYKQKLNHNKTELPVYKLIYICL